MKKIMLLAMFSSSITCMDKVISRVDQTTISHQGADQTDSSLLVIPRAERALVIRLVILYCVLHKDYEGVTHIIEKTKLYPGKFFTAFFDTGPILGAQFKLRIGGYSYRFYKAAYEAGHKRLIRLLSDAQSLHQARIFADSIISTAIEKHPNYEEQKRMYLEIGEAENRIKKDRPEVSSELKELVISEGCWTQRTVNLCKRLMAEELQNL